MTRPRTSNSTGGGTAGAGWPCARSAITGPTTSRLYRSKCSRDSQTSITWKPELVDRPMCTRRPSIFAPDLRPTAACAASYSSTGAGTSVTTPYITPPVRAMRLCRSASAVATTSMIVPPAREVQPPPGGARQDDAKLARASSMGTQHLLDAVPLAGAAPGDVHDLEAARLASLQQ